MLKGHYLYLCVGLALTGAFNLTILPSRLMPLGSQAIYLFFQLLNIVSNFMTWVCPRVCCLTPCSSGVQRWSAPDGGKLEVVDDGGV